MKKIFFTICAAATLFNLTSCNKDTAEYKTADTVTAEISPLNIWDKTKTTIDYSCEQPKIVWSSGDEIKLFNSAGQWAVYTLTSGEGTTTGSFSVKSGQGAITGESAFVAYPADRDVCISGSVISLTNPTECQASMQFPMVGKGELDKNTGNLNATIGTIFHLAKLDLESFSKYDGITNINIVADSPVSGNISIDVETGEITAKSDSNTRNYISISDLSSFEGKHFLVPILGKKNTKLYITTKKGVFVTTLSNASTKSEDDTVTADDCEQVIYPEAPDIQPVVVVGKVWAPVNCGYNETHSYGSLYQWGRKYGQYYEAGPLSLTDMTKADDTEANSAKFGKYNSSYYYNWFSGDVDDALWNGSSKGAGDPCPAGWRVPTGDEIMSLMYIYNRTSTSAHVGGNLQTGRYFGSLIKDYCLFLPCAGQRKHDGAIENFDTQGYYWTSTPSIYSAGAMYFGTADLNVGSTVEAAYRACGKSVRCILE